MIIITDKEEHQLLIDVSVMYYLEGKTQSDIGRELFLSRTKISRLLKKARETQIVDININYQSDAIEQLQSLVKRRFNVEKVIISKTLTKPEDTLVEVSKLAAKEFRAQIKEGMIIGISWGKSVRTTASYLKKMKVEDVKIVELFGATTHDMEGIDLLSIGRSISSKLGGKLYTLPAPIYIEDRDVREAMLKNPVIEQTLNMVENCDLIISGLGSFESDSSIMTWKSYLVDKNKQRVIDKGGIGFLCAHFFDENGRFIDDDVNDSIIGIKTQSIKKKKNIIVACGDKKARVILAALRSGYINTLVSDEETLKLVLKYEDE